MNRIKLFLANIRQSWLFSLVIMCEVTVCICLFAISLTSLSAVGEVPGYYNMKTSGKSYVTFFGYDILNDISYGTLSEKVDMTGLATSVILDGEDYRDVSVTIVTPALVNNFDEMGTEFSGEINKDYREAYARLDQPEYEVDKFYDISVPCGKDEYSVRVKIIGHYGNDEYYDFQASINPDGSLQSSIGGNTPMMLICDNIPNSANVQSGVMINDKSPSYYEDLGFHAVSVKDYYDANKDEDFDALMYLAICCIIFAAASILCNYVLNIDKITKRSAVMYACGETKASVVGMEAIRMISIFLLGFAISFGITAIMISIGISTSSVMVTWENFTLSSVVMLGVYVLSVLIGFIKFARINPLKVLANEHVD